MTAFLLKTTIFSSVSVVGLGGGVSTALIYQPPLINKNVLRGVSAGYKICKKVGFDVCFEKIPFILKNIETIKIIQEKIPLEQLLYLVENIPQD